MHADENRYYIFIPISMLAPPWCSIITVLVTVYSYLITILYLHLKCIVPQVFGETGLADEFQPSVKASCVGGTMTIRVDTALPFDGVVHGPNR